MEQGIFVPGINVITIEHIKFYWGAKVQLYLDKLNLIMENV